MARVRLLPVRIRQRIAQSKNVVNLNDIDDMLLESPEEDIRDDKGVWKLQRRSYKDGYTQLIVSQMEWKNIAKNEAIVPECSTDPVELERMRCEEPLREDFIENPLAEEQTRRERARGIWTEKKTSKLCATLAKTDYKFDRAAEKMKVPRGDCVEHWYSYKRNEKHIENCEACTKQRNKKKKRKEAAALVTAADEVRAVAALAAAAVKPQQPSMSFAREPSEEEEIDVENGDPPPRELWVDPDILAAIAATTPILPSQSDEDDIDVQPSTSFARETSEEENIDIENGDPPQRDLWVDRDVLGAIAASAPPLPTESDKDEIDVDSGSTEVAMRILACDSTIDPQEKRGDNMPSGDWETMGLNILAEAAVSATPLQLTESGQDGFDVDCTGSLKRSQELHQRLERGAKPCDTCDIAGLNILAAVAATSTPFPTAKPGEDEVRGNAGRELKTKNFFSASLRKRSHEGRNSLHSPRATATRAALDHDDIEDGAAPRKRSRAGRRIVVPWRFRNEPQRGRQY